MSDMPERIKASNIFDSWVGADDEGWNGEHTEYIRADLVDERERELTKAAKRLVWSARAGYQVTPSQINELDKAIAKLDKEKTA